MAPSRAFSFPLSYAEAVLRVGPLLVSKKDVAKLGSHAAFQTIRSALRNQRNTEFCDEHCVDSRDNVEAWLLQRDITHALILPILEIYRFASTLAKRLRGKRNIFDLELIFRGEARGAFSWLQCFIAEEEDWCMTRGCPACVVSHALESEPTVRMILVACHFSELTRQQKSTSQLPMFEFWLASLRRALDDDPFWGPDLWKDFETRARRLEKGIEDLVKQCIELGSITPSLEQAGESPPTSPCLPFLKPQNSSLSPLSSYPDRSWTQEIILGCWTTLLADAAEAKQAVSNPELDSKPVAYRTMTA
ncbi:MAG: hypothetical protein Q9190_002799 [Brigantiaea leucoxantha]